MDNATATPSTLPATFDLSKWLLDPPPIRLNKYGGSREHGGCWMNAISMYEGDYWTDHPKCVEPVIRTLGVVTNDNLGEDDRAAIIGPHLLMPVGTRSFDPTVQCLRRSVCRDEIEQIIAKVMKRIGISAYLVDGIYTGTHRVGILQTLEHLLRARQLQISIPHAEDNSVDIAYLPLANLFEQVAYFFDRDRDANVPYDVIMSYATSVAATLYGLPACVFPTRVIAAEFVIPWMECLASMHREPAPMTGSLRSFACSLGRRGDVGDHTEDGYINVCLARQIQGTNVPEVPS